MAQAILRLPAVMARTGMSRSALYLAINEGAFPKPIKIGRRSVGWVATEVDDWISDRIQQSRKAG